MNIPKPQCHWGYPTEQVKAILGTRYEAFCKWGADGLTMMTCDGSECTEAHGPVTFQTDVEAFLRGQANTD